MIGTEDFIWKDDKLYLGKKDTGFRVTLSEVQFDYEPPEEDIGLMFRVQYPGSEVSKDYYNLSRAKNHCISEASIHFNTTENGTR